MVVAQDATFIFPLERPSMGNYLRNKEFDESGGSPPSPTGEAAEKHTVFQVYFYNTQKIHQFRLFWWIFCYPDKISDYFKCYLCLFFVYQFNDPFEVYCKYSHRSLHLHVNEA